MTDLQKALATLREGGYTCVLCRGEHCHTSTRRGIAPLLQALDSGVSFAGYSAADKVVGRATALLYRLLGIEALYGEVVSQSALEVLRDGGIRVAYGTLTAHIVNRQGTGQCPMEEATAHISDPRQAPQAIRARLAQLKENQ